MRRAHALVLLLAAAVGATGAGCAPTPEDEAVRQSESLTANAAYNLGSMASPGKCLDVSGAGFSDGSNVQQWTCNGTGAQAFATHARADGKLELVNTRTGKCVDVDHNGSADRTNVQLWTCNDSGAQAFRLDDAGGGRVRIVHLASNKCVDVDGAGSADGTNVQLYTCNGTNAQLWAPAPTPYRIKIMPLGASITDGTGGTHAGYRGPLDGLLNGAGIAHQFVGSATDNPGPLAADQRHHEGHPGYVIAAGTSGRAGLQDNLNAWLGAGGADPDYILLLVGSNDVDLNYKLDTAGNRMDTLLSTIVNRQSGLRPRAHVLVATLPLINNADTETRSKAYNATITQVAERHRAAGENVSVVDVHAVITPADKFDNLHPNDAGYDKIAKLWYSAITGY